MQRFPKLWKAGLIVFISSFCVMVVELIAGRLMAPYIGVSLYTWTSIIGVILAGIAIGNYLGGKIADKYPSPLVLAAIFLAGALLTVAILPLIKIMAGLEIISRLPLMLSFIIRITIIFILPAIVLSMVSPMVIKITLADLGQTGGIVGTIYAISTAGSILGTFLTGFYFIIWFGLRNIVWIVVVVLFLTGILAWFSWNIKDRWKISARNIITWIVTLAVIVIMLVIYLVKPVWQQTFTRESNYYSIQVSDAPGGIKVLALDHLIHSYVVPGKPTVFKYDYLKVFQEIVGYVTRDNSAPKVLHLGGGGYSFPRYMEYVYPASTNEVIEIDPAVTQVAHQQLDLSLDTSIKTNNLDARLFLIERKNGPKYDIVIGDVFNDKSTPYHLTTLEFDQLLKSNMSTNGIYLVNIIDEHVEGRYLPAFLNTLGHVFKNVYLFSISGGWQYASPDTYVIAATDQPIDLSDYSKFIGAYHSPDDEPTGNPLSETEIAEYLKGRNPILLTDDYAPTDILISFLFR